MPAQLRISTIDSFCYELALQQPLLSGLGGGLDITERPAELYRRAARRTLEQIGEGDLSAGTASLGPAIEALLSWRDNGLQEMEDLLVKMLAERDRWMQEFWLRDFAEMREADWDALRASLERPFARAVAEARERTRSASRRGHARRGNGPGALFLRPTQQMAAVQAIPVCGAPVPAVSEPRCVGGSAPGLSLHGADAADK